jgi:two-component system KDP operon response regulator KdpE
VNTGPIILVIDDEAPMRRLLDLTLSPHGYRVRSAVNGREGISMAGTERAELFILDLGLPDIDGIDVLREIRKQSKTPTIILSVRSAERDIVECLNEGADDYLVKPFRTGELLARMKTALRHNTRVQEMDPVNVGAFSVDFSGRIVRKNGVIVKLTATEYSLFALFVQNQGRVLTHRFILETVWGPTFAEESQYTRVYVGQLRKKIEDDPSNPKWIITESGIGYRFQID